jgi:hypothetical protein
MVVLEAAAITAGSVAAFKGGKAAVTATAKTVKSKLSLSNREKARKEVIDSRKEERAERFSKVNQYRDSLRDANGGKVGGGLPGGVRWKSDGGSRGCTSSRPSSAASATAARTTTKGSKESFSRSWWGK